MKQRYPRCKSQNPAPQQLLKSPMPEKVRTKLTTRAAVKGICLIMTSGKMCMIDLLHALAIPKRSVRTFATTRTSQRYKCTGSGNGGIVDNSKVVV